MSIDKKTKYFTLLKHQSIAFKSIMPQNLSQLILSFLHFADNDPLDLQRNQLNKVPPLMEYWISKFQETYTPSIFINTG